MDARTLAERKRAEEKQKRLDRIYRERSERAAREMEGELGPALRALLRPAALPEPSDHSGLSRQGPNAPRLRHCGLAGLVASPTVCLPQPALPARGSLSRRGQLGCEQRGRQQGQRRCRKLSLPKA